MLIWKIYGERLDGFANDDHPSENEPGSGKLLHHGKEVDVAKNKSRADLDYLGKSMPPPDASGTKPLSDEDRRSIVRWIDLGCPIDLDFDPAHPERTGFGWMLDDQRPTLTVTEPPLGKSAAWSRILIGMYDYGSGIDPGSLRVESDIALDGTAAGENLAKRFRELSPGVWEMHLSKPINDLKAGWLFVSIADKQGNVTRLERRFKIGK